MRFKVAIAINTAFVLSLLGCEEEQTFRRVRFKASGSELIQYRTSVLISPDPPVFDADTSGLISIDFSGEVGDTVIYFIGTLGQSVHAELLVNDELVMVHDVTASPLPKAVSGRYILK